eukprot:s1579_g32.t1
MRFTVSPLEAPFPHISKSFALETVSHVSPGVGNAEACGNMDPTAQNCHIGRPCCKGFRRPPRVEILREAVEAVFIAVAEAKSEGAALGRPDVIQLKSAVLLLDPTF